MGIIVQLVHQERLRPFQLVDPFGEELRPQTLARKELVKETKWLETSRLSLHPEYRSTTFQSILSEETSASDTYHNPSKQPVNTTAQSIMLPESLERPSHTRSCLELGLSFSTR